MVLDESMLIDATMCDLLDRNADATPDAPAVTIASESGIEAWSYAELRHDVDRLARGLMSWGVERGERAAVMGPNSGSWILLEYALARIGAVLVTVNPSSKRDEIAYLLKQGQVGTLIFEPTFRGYDVAAALRDILPDLASSVDGLRTGAKFPKLRRLACFGQVPFALPFEHLSKMASDTSEFDLAFRAAEVKPVDVGQIQFTSGTTGAPKGAMLTHRSMLNNARMMSARAGVGPDDVMLSAMPFFHTAGCVCNVMGMLAAGGHLIALDTFDAGRMLALWHGHRPTIINAVPTMYARLLDHPNADTHDLTSLRLAKTGGTSIPPTLMRRLKQVCGADPMIVMGMTECGPVITITDPEDDLETRISTVGTPLPHTEVRIADPATGETLPAGVEGELLIRGYNVMAGYFGMPDKTAETIDADGWLRSGDLAVLTETGRLRIVGRLKDMLIRGGENVYPAEIEDCLCLHPSVSQAQVVGAPHHELGEDIYAFVLPRAGAALDPDALRAHVRDHLAHHKAPRWIEVVERFPETVNGKVRKVELREIAVRHVEARP